MKTMQEMPNQSGAYPPIQELPHIPDGWLEISNACDTSSFYEAHGFVTLMVESGIVTGFIPNMESWAAWKAEHPEPPAQPDTTADLAEMVCDLLYEIDKIKLGVLQNECL